MGEEDIVREAKDLLTDRKMIEYRIDNYNLFVYLRYKKESCELYLKNLGAFLEKAAGGVDNYYIADLQFPDEAYSCTALHLDFPSSDAASKAGGVLEDYICVVFGDNYVRTR
jgi:hypothetical protein